MYRKFPRPRSIGEFFRDDGSPILDTIGQPILDWAALDAWATSIANGRPAEFVVAGIVTRRDGRQFVELRANPAYLEAVGYAYDPSGRLRQPCPECGTFGGNHKRTCELR